MHINLQHVALALASLPASTASAGRQHPLPPPPDVVPQSITPAFFSSLERLSRLVDIAYCVGTTGVTPPFSCASRCRDFPSLRLVSTWNTGLLSMADSCGYVAVDHGLSGPEGRDVPHPPAILVAFRGTYSLANTVVDLSTVPQEYVPYPEEPPGSGNNSTDDRGRCDNCTVHTGFLASWLSARKLVLPALRAARERHPTYPVHLVGHSLGGAVAALAALELRLSLGLSEVLVTTFGEPRVGNRGLVEYLDRVFGLDADDGYDADLEKRRYRRVTHVGDPVPLLPLAEWGFRSHAGEVYISKGELQPGPEDVRICRGDEDEGCIAAGGEAALVVVKGVGREREVDGGRIGWEGKGEWLKPWELFFAHRDYFWRLGLCVPGGDPSDWGREGYNLSSSVGGDEL
ncbi:Alpha/beta-hydrolase [Coniochaeta hoffmannii]|uniref:Alpha/beta-hydrolase n=1 Tax=Coniochaeta hoffmannii TaxID=91930 RepID=A0AA38R9Q0_9PEZI|nr:Alpha/beta-hydrolase [Coniochaeta hoffmannii]